MLPLPARQTWDWELASSAKASKCLQLTSEYSQCYTSWTTMLIDCTVLFIWQCLIDSSENAVCRKQLGNKSPRGKMSSWISFPFGYFFCVCIWNSWFFWRNCLQHSRCCKLSPWFKQRLEQVLNLFCHILRYSYLHICLIILHKMLKNTENRGKERLDMLIVYLITFNCWEIISHKVGFCTWYF